MSNLVYKKEDKMSNDYVNYVTTKLKYNKAIDNHLAIDESSIVEFNDMIYTCVDRTPDITKLKNNLHRYRMEAINFVIFIVGSSILLISLYDYASVKFLYKYLLNKYFLGSFLSIGVTANIVGYVILKINLNKKKLYKEDGIWKLK